MKTVGFRRRFAAILIDFIILLFLIPLLINLIVLADTFEYWFQVIFFVYEMAGLPIVMMILEANWERTPGKKLLKIKTVKEDGSRIGYKEAVIRRIPLAFWYALPVIFYDVIYMFRSDRPLRQRYFDKLAHTVVIYAK